MISDYGTRDRFHTPPTQIIGLQKRLVAATIILIIPQRQDRSQPCIHKQVRSIFLPAGVGGAITAVKA
jgi:hypothetical protein